jgi:hypothetical protein
MWAAGPAPVGQSTATALCCARSRSASVASPASVPSIVTSSPESATCVTQVHRQSFLPFTRALRDVRRGIAMSDNIRAVLRDMERPLPPRDDGLRPTELFPCNA